ncbi:hypothetical protein [Helicobacter cholecystus]|uniref:hypothetical protein n=1 Tax=Helicobacter cholecystus TaxID=45498 RepID=UPI002738E062|nr:hypothetical protein [Helicobacter cholecystus]
MDFLHICHSLGLETRIARCVLDIQAQEVQEIGGKFLQEYIALNQIEESGIEKWLKLSKGRDYEGDEVMLELLVEMYKKLERLEQKLSIKENPYIPLELSLKTHSIGHSVLCFEEELQEGGLYYARCELPVFPTKIIPLFFVMLTPFVAKITKIGQSHNHSYDAYVVECERMEIRSKREVE